MLFKDELWRVFAPSGAAADAAEEPAETPAPEATDDTPVEEAVEEVAEEEIEEQPAGLGEVWKQHGIEGLPEDPQEFQRTYRAMQAQAAEAQRYREYAGILYQQNQIAMQQQRPPVQQEPERPKLPWGDAPQFDRRLIDQITTDENGNLIPKPGAMPNVVDDYRKWVAWRDSAQEKFFSDPASIKSLFQPDWQKDTWQIVQHALAQDRQQTALKTFENANREWLYNEYGQLSQAGNLWNNAYVQALQMRLPDPIQYAEQVIDATLYRQKVEADAATQGQPKTDAEKKNAFLHRAARLPNRSGTQPKKTRKTPSQNDKRDPWELLKENIAALPPEDWQN